MATGVDATKAAARAAPRDAGMGVRIAAAALGGAALAVRHVAGHSLRCDEAWTGPSKNNNIIDCLAEYPKKEPGMLVPPAIAAVVLVVALLMPLVLLCRLCGAFGSSKPRPGGGCCCGGSEWDSVPTAEKLMMYPRPYVFRVKLAAWLTLLGSVVVVGLFTAGGKILTDAARDTMTSARVDVADWAADVSKNVQQALTKQDTTFVDGVDGSMFTTADDFIERMRSYIGTGEDWYSENSRWVFWGIVGAGCIPFLALLVPVLLACCNVRECVPGCCSCVMILIAVIYGVLGVGGVTAGMVFTSACGEIDLYKNGQPGVLQWFAVPWCEDQVDFGAIKSQIENARSTFVTTACNAASSYCSPAAAFNSNNPDKVFVCDPLPTTSSSNCASVKAVSEYVRGLQFKSGVTGCTACTTFASCLQDCTGVLRSNVETTEAALADGERALEGLELLTPLASCDALMTRALTPLENCTDLTVGWLCLGVGGVIAALLCISGIIVLLKGSKVFFNREAIRRRAQELYEASPKVAHPMPQHNL